MIRKCLKINLNAPNQNTEVFIRVMIPLVCTNSFAVNVHKGTTFFLFPMLRLGSISTWVLNLLIPSIEPTVRPLCIFDLRILDASVFSSRCSNFCFRDCMTCCVASLCSFVLYSQRAEPSVDWMLRKSESVRLGVAASHTIGKISLCASLAACNRARQSDESTKSLVNSGTNNSHAVTAVASCNRS